MATYYSSLYELAPFRGAQNFIPRSPQVDHRAVPVTEIFTFNVASGVVLNTNDVIKLLPAVPSGAKVTRCVITVPGYDGGAALVVNLGWASQANGAGVVTGFGPIRAAGTTSVTDAQILAQTAANGTATVLTNNQAAGAQDELLLYVTTGAASAGTNGVATVLVEYIAP